MNTAQAILYSTLIFAVSSDICDKRGICLGTTLKEVHAHDSFDCWKKCLSHNGCKYASFAQNSHCQDYSYSCTLFRDCLRLHDDPCDYVTSSRNCAHCDFTGLCIVSTNLAPLHLF